MIKIRYRNPNEISPGLFAAAESHGRGTTVYLLSGLTPAERQAALRRLRLSARMGHGIRLPAAQLALALVADWVRTRVGRAGAVFRSHPAGSALPIMVVSAGVIAFLLLSAVSIRVLHPATALNKLPPSFPAPTVSVIAEPGSNVAPTPAAGGLGPRGDSPIGTTARGKIGTDRWLVFSPPSIGGFGTGSLTGGGTADGSGTTSSGGNGNGSTGTGSTGTGSGSTGTGSGGSGSGTGTGGGTPTPTPTPTPSASSPAPSPSPSVTPTPAPTPAPSTPTGTGGDGNCLDVGPLGVCLDV